MAQDTRERPDARALPRREDAAALTVVGLGASAGGVQALQAFFANTPPDSGLAFIVVMHLSPDHESHLAEVLGRTIAMPVRQVDGPVRIEPNHVYVIPPSKDLAFEDGLLRAISPRASPGRRVAIDQFFRALAGAHGPESVAVVFSGAGADGALGLKQIKEVGGLAVAQDPEEAAFDAMPRSAIATGLVDFVLSAGDMAAQIVAYRDATQRMLLPAEAAPSPGQRDERPETETVLAGILSHLRGQTGHDFAPYKRATVLRRIGRRLQVNDLPDLPAYLGFLHRDSGEAKGLLNDLLISVTQFFRDPEVWEAMARDVIPRLFEKRGPSEEVRVWVCGCATGEEAYSLAILLLEQAAKMDRPPRVQVFATDMSAQAIAAAREGAYPETITADVSPERLRAWFYRDNGSYRVRKEVREAVLFALHDVLRDTPFSRLDLITCRNLLIYLNAPAQTRIFEIFHFALRTDGRLLLGSSEAMDAASFLFGAVDKPLRIYVRRPGARPVPLVSPTPPRTLSLPEPAPSPDRPAPPQPDGEAFPPAAPRALSAGEVHLDLLERYAPPSVLINEDYQILHLSGGAGRFLRFAGGVPSADLLRVVHPDLRLDVSAALYAARAEGRDQTRRVSASLDADGPARPVRVTVRPVREPEGTQGFFLVLFQAQTEEAGGEGAAAPAEAPLSETDTEVVREMEMEIARLQIRLRSTVDQYESSAEELKASNEELQAVNEEMRSATEELETSREELQSVNEELSTVNQELKNRIEDVSHANADLHNLLVSTDIATIFVDRELRVKRYTPMAEMLFNIIPTDIGRPLGHLTHKLEYDGLTGDAEAVLLRLASQEREIRSADGRHFLARLSPYRTQEDRINGVVVTFVDITARKQAEEELRRAAEFSAFRVTLADALRPLDDPATVQAQAARVLGERLGASRVHYAEMEADDEHAVVGPHYTRGAPEVSERAGRYDLSAFNTLIGESRAGRVLAAADIPADARFGDAEKGMFASLAAAALLAVPLVKEGRLVALLAVHLAAPHAWTDAEIALTEETAERTWDAVERARSEAALRDSEHRLRRAFSIETVGVIFFKVDGQVTQTNDAFLSQSGYTRQDLEAGLVRWDTMTPPEYVPKSLKAIDEFLETGRTTPYEKEFVRKDGTRWWGLFAATRVTDDEGVEFIIDMTASRQAARALRESEERFRLLVAGARDYAMFLLDSQYRITFWSAGAEHVFGWTEAEALGQPGDIIFTPEDRAQKRPEQESETAAATGSAADRRWHVRKDGSRLWADGVLMRLDGAGNEGRGFAKITRDATAEREAEVALRTAHAEMESRVVERTETLSQALVSLETALAERRQVEAERQDLRRQLLLAQEAERGRISRELHDQMGQHLTGLLLGLKTLETSLAPTGPGAELVVRLQQVAAEISAEVHHLAWDLRPAALDDLGLEATLQNYTQQWGERFGVAADFHSRNVTAVRLPPDVETAFYRIAQEALTNVARHAGAGKVGVLLERRGDHALLIVEDDGAGFDAEQALSRPQRLGIGGMRERAALVGGTLSIESAPGAGTTLFVRIPLTGGAEEAPHA